MDGLLIKGWWMDVNRRVDGCIAGSVTERYMYVLLDGTKLCANLQVLSVGPSALFSDISFLPT